LEIEGKKIERLPDTLMFDMEYTEQKNEKSLDLKIVWSSSRQGKKS
jgi:hypothetical protein